MPQGDRKGPQVQGPKAGKGRGKCRSKNSAIAPQGQGGVGVGGEQIRVTGKSCARGQSRGRRAEQGRGRQS